NACHDGRGKRSAPCARPINGRLATGNSCGPGVAIWIVVQPGSVGGKERNIGNVAHPVVGISENRLVRRLGPARARAADHAGTGGRSGRAATWSTAASNRIQEIRVSLAAIAEPARSVSLAETLEFPE